MWRDGFIPVNVTKPISRWESDHGEREEHATDHETNNSENKLHRTVNDDICPEPETHRGGRCTQHVLTGHCIDD